MNFLRTANRKLASATGFEIRRAGAAGPVVAASRVSGGGHGAMDEVTQRQAARSVDFRPPADPAVDRLVRQPVFIMSPVRSGSTLLRMLLGAHPRLHAAHELHIRRLEVRCGTHLAERAMDALDLPRGDLEHLLWDRVLHRELMKSGKDFIVEKTPSNAFAYQRIAACWPDARFIFLLRHPVSIARSWHEADPDKRTPEEAALDALRYMRATERARQALPGHTIRYEDLTDDPKGTVAGICDFLGVPFEPAMLDYGSKGDAELQKGLGDWKDKIRTGAVQPGRDLPAAADIPEALREISTLWGYLDGKQPRPGRQDAPAAHAEIAEVWAEDGRIRLTGDVPAAEAGAETSWRLLLTLRGGDRALTYDAPVDGNRFVASFPVAELAAPGLPVPAQWDVHLAAGRGQGGRRLRAGSHRDGVRGKKNIVVFPAQSTASGGAHGPGPVRVQPYYTVKDNLSVECFTDATPTAERVAP